MTTTASLLASVAADLKAFRKEHEDWCNETVRVRDALIGRMRAEGSAMSEIALAADISKQRVERILYRDSVNPIDVATDS